MYSYSSSSMSLFGNSRSRYSPTRRYENRSPVARTAPECVTPKRTTKVTTTVTTPPPPIIERECRSPFVTPNHPLYMFGDSNNSNSNNNNNEVEADFEVEPSRPQKVKNCLDSMNGLSLSSPREEAPSPFRRLQLSRAFDEQDEFHATQSYETPCVRRHQSLTLCPPQAEPQDRVIRKSSAFGMEEMREISIDADDSSNLVQKLSVIEADLEGKDGLATRLRRMKRRLFLENVASSPQQQESLEATPKHSNRMSDDVTMEGMEVVLEDHFDPSTNSDSIDGLYLTFSSSSLSLQMEIDEDDEEDDDESLAETSETADWLMMAPLKKLSGDSSVMTEATVACSTFENSFGNDDTHWASLSSITEQA